MITEDIILVIVEALAAILLFFLAGYAEKKISTKWKLLYAMPFLICMIILGISGFEKTMVVAYIAAIVPLYGFIKEEVKPRKIACIIAFICAILGYSTANDNPDYRPVDYVADFNKAFDMMKDNYVLSEYKNIDWDMLYNKYLPEIEAANEKHDKVRNAELMTYFAAEFNDGHVAYMTFDDDLNKAVEEKIAGNDYGLSMMTLSDGTVVACNVDESLKKLGITNGTEITSWDNVSINEAVSSVTKKFSGFAVEENENFYKAAMLAGTGGDSVEVKYLDETGAECLATLPTLGSYADRLVKTIETINAGVNISNIEWMTIDSETSLVRINSMTYDAESMKSDDYSVVKEAFKAELIQHKSEGMKNLIMDLRANNGGSDEFVKAIMASIAPEGATPYVYDGVYNIETKAYEKNSDGSYKTSTMESVEGENLFADGNIYVLVNADTISGGDHMTKLLSECPNVKLLGLTPSNCSGQGITGVMLEEGGIQFSTILLVDEKGEIFVDAGTDRKATIELDEKIPLTKEAIKMIFDDGEDYVLQYLLDNM